jgi:putative NIF3 family GTP cyclohydrolase 1 type 2
MHLSEKHIQEAAKQNINAVIAGHIASDNLGLNLLVDEIAKGENLEIIACSGFYRVER